MSKINTNPVAAAIFYFVMTWAGYPLAAMIRSLVKGISFTEAAMTPEVYLVYAALAIITSVQMYLKVENRNQ